MGSNVISAELLAERFSNFVMRKTTIIRNKIISDSPINTCNISVDADIMLNEKILEMFRPDSAVEAMGLISKSPNKLCDLDLLLTWLLQTCVDHFLPLITAIISRSMDESVLLLCLKRATITSLATRSRLDKEDIKNYHLISNSLPPSPTY